MQSMKISLQREHEYSYPTNSVLEAVCRHRTCTVKTSDASRQQRSHSKSKEDFSTKSVITSVSDFYFF